jgi:hypothetical protein
MVFVPDWFVLVHVQAAAIAIATSNAHHLACQF